ncbi:hypothetical protein PHAVU_008G175400 [Phaseolus vulgaris]|uniref:Putative plant transposon protein domain-containing protein n=1 Tax=Phaseolus vulgaris TaxID=3885 RepID=V7B8L6_PHAVU|nr:hypothetical protein PHAVU_008G175400g [Phaseolus vulgaris]ESW13193.1 hypothetical protein PHAVU_008G175400g [Phaseolus vulgaris]
MAPKTVKRTQKASTSHAQGKQPMVEPSRHKLFRDEFRKEQYEAIKHWTIIPERQVKLEEGEYSDFDEELTRRKWGQLAMPVDKYDPHVVLEFYANAWPVKKGETELRSKFLGNPLQLDEDGLCTYGMLKQRTNFTSFSNRETLELLCILGQTYETNNNGKALRIIWSSMITLTQIRTWFLLSNVIPNKHNSYLSMGKCYIVLCLLKQYEVDVETLISNSIHHFVLQQANGIQINISTRIRPPMDKKFIQRNCSNKDQQQSQGQQSEEGEDEAVVPPINQLHSPTVPEMNMVDYMKNLESHMKHIQMEQATNHIAMVSLNGSFHSYVLHHSAESKLFGPTLKNLSIWLNGLVTKLFSLHNRKKVMKKFMTIKMTPTTPMLDEFP